MSFFDRFTKKKDDDDIQYHAIAKVLINLACDVEESERFAKDLRLTEDEFSEFHMHKRELACKTVLYSAAISMEPSKRSKFVDIFMVWREKKDDLENAPADVREMIVEMNKITDQAYHEIFTKVTNYIQNNQTNSDPVDLLRASFSRLFCVFLEQGDNQAYLEIGEKIFSRHHGFALDSVKKL
jgi:hypothetical protein